MPMSRFASYLLAAMAAATLASCASAPKPTSRDEPAAPAQAEIAPSASLAPAAFALEEAGDFAAAAREYTRLAAEAAPPLRYELQLSAAAALVKGNFFSEAGRALELVPDAELDATLRTRRQLLVARIALGELRGQDALAALQPIQINEDPVLLLQFYQLRAQAYRMIGNPIEASLDLINSEPLITELDALRANQNEIWQLLTSLPPETLRSMAAETTSDAVKGWVRLAEIATTYYLPGVDLDAQIADWRERYPLHQASEEIVQGLLALKRDQIYRPRQIALLLPQSGPFAKSATAVRDGFFAAYFAEEDAGYRPLVRFYDSGELLEQANRAYDEAVADGAQLIIGPLTKEGVNALSEREHLPVPTLALNYASTERAPANLFQFGLAPEDEVRQVAERAWLDGHNQAILLVVDGPWGERIAATFNQHWRQLGGTVLETQYFKNNESDFSQPLQQLLNIDDSYRRMKALKQVLRTDLKFEPRRRMDADFIFVGVPSPQQARQVRPQLKFYYASDLPMYTTSHAFSGVADPAVDHDMDGVLFCDMPWTLATPPSPLWTTIVESWGEASHAYRRLYALGVDSFGLIAHLRRLSTFRFQQFQGVTGILSLNEQNQIQRQLTWAKFERGVPQVLGTQGAR